MDLEIRRKVTKTASKISGLWKEEAVMEGKNRSCTFLVEPARERKKETVVKVGMVPEDVPDRQVLQKVLERLKADGWNNELAMWIFLDAQERVKVRLPMGPVLPGMGRLQIREELQRENPEIIFEGRLPEL